MSRRKIEDIVADISLPVLNRLGYELVDVEFKKEGPSWYLRIYIDKESGITLDDCQIASEEISQLLDEVDPIEQSYILELSSPGIDRPLKTEKDFEKAKGSDVEIKLYKPFNGRKIYEGKLLGLNQGKIQIESDSHIISFRKEEVALVKPVIKF